MFRPPRAYKPFLSSRGAILGIISGVSLLCLAPVGGLLFFGARTFGPAMGCSFTTDTIAVALRDYAAAHGGRLPAAERWQTDLKPYYEAVRAKAGGAGRLALPAPGEAWGCGSGGDRTALAFNADLGGETAADLTGAETRVLVFETSGAPAVDRSERFDPARVGAAPRVGGIVRDWRGISAAFGPLDIREGGTVTKTKPVESAPIDVGIPSGGR